MASFNGLHRARLIVGAGKALVAAVWALAVGACSGSYDFTGSQFSCQITNQCPAGFTCENGVCVEPGQPAADGSVVLEGAEGETSGELPSDGDDEEEGGEEEEGNEGEGKEGEPPAEGEEEGTEGQPTDAGEGAEGSAEGAEGTPAPPDGGAQDAGPGDAGPADGGVAPSDAGVPTDGGVPVDGGEPPDAGIEDAGVPDGGVELPDAGLVKVCNKSADCPPGFTCKDGFCCDNPCDGECESCNVKGREGKCSPIPKDTDPDSECSKTGGICASSCNGAKKCSVTVKGIKCGICFECDGKGACGPVAPGTKDPGCGECSTCSSEGACVPTTAGQDPNDDCADEQPTNRCGTTGACDGAGKCMRPAVGSVCGNTTCLNDKFVSGEVCTVFGVCDTSTEPCAPFNCQNGACLTSCTKDEECAGGLRCVGNDCRDTKPPGAACTQDAECESRHCVEQICCDKDCAGPCKTCKSFDNPGVCTVTAGVVCESAKCASNAYVGSAICDVSGACVAPTPVPCNTYACNATTGGCKTSCQSQSDCAGASQCNGGQCSCNQDCTGKQCGSDGCGGSCGTCGNGLECASDGRCRCPAGMIYVTAAGAPVCIDAFEASRPDATSTQPGNKNTVAKSVAGVVPWTLTGAQPAILLQQAQAYCDAAGKRLCTAAEWTSVCRGPNANNYPYGPTLVTGQCNDASAGVGKVQPTGSYADCKTPEGVYDMTGNVTEIVSDIVSTLKTVGGSFKTTGANATCTVAEPIGMFAAYYGFRCCADPN